MSPSKTLTAEERQKFTLSVHDTDMVGFGEIEVHDVLRIMFNDAAHDGDFRVHVREKTFPLSALPAPHAHHMYMQTFPLSALPAPHAHHMYMQTFPLSALPAPHAHHMYMRVR
jgi:hypothetical protein